MYVSMNNGSTSLKDPKIDYGTVRQYYYLIDRFSTSFQDLEITKYVLLFPSISHFIHFSIQRISRE